ncbi:MAG: hypothetical protein FGM24_10765 [Candidatus Kapabacteria bacterium]|nr:hypothetical protein [Candidatus Kapabacteria bacterium]
MNAIRRAAVVVVLWMTSLHLSIAQIETPQADVSTGPAQDAVGIRIMHASVDGNVIRLHVAPVDSDGRVPSTSIIGTWSASITRRDSGVGTVVDATVLPRGRDRAQSGTTVLCIDNAAAAGGLARKAVAAVRDLGFGLLDNDSIAVLAYDHTLSQLAPLGSGMSLPTVITDAPEPSGLTAMYSALGAAIDIAKASPSADRDVIVMVASDDNASINDDLTSIVRRAREAGVRISTIRIGTSTLGFVHRYLAGATGGMSAALHADSLSAATSLMRYIVMARRNFMDVSLPLPAEFADAPDLDVAITVASGGTSASDTMRIPLRTRQYRQQRLIVSAYADAADTSIGNFRGQLALLAESMADDTTSVIEVIGHVGKGTKDAGTRAMRRANSVANALIAMGAAADRITVRSDGDSRALYPFELMPWQQRMNNRVEVRRRTADPYPYDVVVAKVRTESQADEQIAVWEGRGYKAYYDVSTADGEPLYRVMLWGYTSKADAEAAAAVVRSEHNAPAAYVD